MVPSRHSKWSFFFKSGWLYPLPSLCCKWWFTGLDSRRAWHPLQLWHGAQGHWGQRLPSSAHRDHSHWRGGLGLPHDCGQGAHQGVCALTVNWLLHSSAAKLLNKTSRQHWLLNRFYWCWQVWHDVLIWLQVVSLSMWIRFCCSVEGHWVSTAKLKNYNIIFCATNFQYFHYWTWASPLWKLFTR